VKRQTNIRIDTTRRGAWPNERRKDVVLVLASLALLALALVGLVLVLARA